MNKEKEWGKWILDNFIIRTNGGNKGQGNSTYNAILKNTMKLVLLNRTPCGTDFPL